MSKPYQSGKFMASQPKSPAPLYAQVRFKDRLPLNTSDLRDQEAKLHTEVTAMMHIRHRSTGECHYRVALPEVLFGMVDGFHPLVKIAVAKALLHAERENLKRADVTVEGNLVTARWKADRDEEQGDG